MMSSNSLFISISQLMFQLLFSGKLQCYLHLQAGYLTRMTLLRCSVTQCNVLYGWMSQSFNICQLWYGQRKRQEKNDVATHSPCTEAHLELEEDGDAGRLGKKGVKILPRRWDEGSLFSLVFNETMYIEISVKSSGTYSLFIYQDEKKTKTKTKAFVRSCMFWNKLVTNNNYM